MRRIYVERTGRMPADDFRAMAPNTAQQRRPLIAIAMVALLVATGGFVAANIYGVGQSPAPQLAMDSGVSLQPVTNFIELQQQTEGDNLGTQNAQSVLENAVHAMHDM